MTNAFAIDLFEPNKCEMKWNNRSDKQEGSAVRRYIGIRFDTDVRVRIDFRDMFTWLVMLLKGKARCLCVVCFLAWIELFKDEEEKWLVTTRSVSLRDLCVD